MFYSCTQTATVDVNRLTGSDILSVVWVKPLSQVSGICTPLSIFNLHVLGFITHHVSSFLLKFDIIRMVLVELID